MSHSDDGVVLLHGILLSRHSMALLARFLKKQGFRVLNLDYPSTRQSLDALAEGIHLPISEFSAAVAGKIHFIGFSMGGLLIRAYLAKHRPENLGKVLMIGTPNGGSEMANMLQHNRLYRKIYGPAGQQLITDQSAFSHVFGKVDYELGILAGEARFDPVASYVFKKPNDGKVSVESTKLEGMSAHHVLKTSHTLFPYRPRVWRYAVEFLKDGTFASH